MRIVWIIYWAIVGAVAGSFLITLKDRTSRKDKSLWSHCCSCGHRLSFLDLIPVLSWLVLKGKCKYCKSKIPVNILSSEIAGGIAGFLFAITML
jgi:leader peptidase (prepilin peptidase) / N-methyltransferase